MLSLLLFRVWSSPEAVPFSRVIVSAVHRETTVSGDVPMVGRFGRCSPLSGVVDSREYFTRTGSDAFQATDARVAVSDDDVFVPQNPYFLYDLFRAGVHAFPAGDAMARVRLYEWGAVFAFHFFGNR